MILPSMGQNLRVIIIGAKGGIGQALVNALCQSDQVESIHALSRTTRPHPSPKVFPLNFDFTSEDSLAQSAKHLRQFGPFHLIIIATGLLHDADITPEKSIRDLSFQGFEKSFLINTIGPAMTAKYFLPLLCRDQKTVFAALSARVGSLSDNRLGGWYAYRAAKAALNMIIKTLSIEYGRRLKQAVIIGLHPGTVNTKLSQPFQNNVPEGQLFSPDFSAKKLLTVIDDRNQNESGLVFDWAGKQIPF